MRQAFIYLAYKPDTTANRIARVYGSLKKYVPTIDFHIVTFDATSEEGVCKRRFANVIVPHTIYNLKSLRSLNYPSRPTNGEFSLTARGYVDLPIILFWLNNKSYSGLWVMEDDVEFTGEFGNLIKELNETNTDVGLACTHLRKVPDDWDYMHMFSSGADVIPPSMQRRVCFLPFFFITADALSIIHSAYQRGWAGYNEMSWAVILDLAGIPIRDIGGNGPYVAPEDRNRRYIDRSEGNFDKLGSFGTLNIRLFPGRDKNILWHPVKTPREFVRARARRMLSIWHWYKDKFPRDWMSPMWQRRRNRRFRHDGCLRM